jgi:hypothetical protein
VVAKKLKQPWERRRGESAAAYARFLLFRNLGPARSLDAAYQAYVATAETADSPTDSEVGKGDKKRRAPGSWQKEAVAQSWADRAAAWDVAMLSDLGRATVVSYCSVLERIGTRGLVAVVDNEIAPKSWHEILEALQVIGTMLPQGLIRDVALQGQGDRGCQR